jgi:hypothetical protein
MLSASSLVSDRVLVSALIQEQNARAENLAGVKAVRA